jgi:hypothetical protein
VIVSERDVRSHQPPERLCGVELIRSDCMFDVRPTHQHPLPITVSLYITVSLGAHEKTDQGRLLLHTAVSLETCAHRTSLAAVCTRWLRVVPQVVSFDTVRLQASGILFALDHEMSCHYLGPRLVSAGSQLVWLLLATLRRERPVYGWTHGDSGTFRAVTARAITYATGTGDVAAGRDKVLRRFCACVERLGRG